MDMAPNATMPGLAITTNFTGGAASSASAGGIHHFSAGSGAQAQSSASHPNNPATAGAPAAGPAMTAAQQQQPQPQPQGPPPPPLTKPPISPITPTLKPVLLPGVGGRDRIPVPRSGGSGTSYTAQPTPAGIAYFAANRVALTHSSQLDASKTAIEGPPPPRAIDFDSNPDVLALKSAIAILQIQRARAAADVEKLARAKAAALDEPEAFLRDLAEGRVDVGASAPTLFGGAGDDDSDSDDDGDGGEAMAVDDDGGKGKQPASSSDASSSSSSKPPPPPPWREFPQRQNVVRCPPINWSQYAVAGDSLDKLHNEQLNRPNPGVPATVVVHGGGSVPIGSGSGAGVGASAGPGFSFEFKGEQVGTPGQKLVGVVSPYTPGRDKLEKKHKGGGGARK